MKYILVRSAMRSATSARSKLGWAASICVALSLHLSISSAALTDGYDAYLRGDYDTAFQEMMPIAQAGDSSAAYYLGLLYWEGNGVEKNLEAAIAWFVKAATLGHTGAQLSLGLAYESGLVVEKNYLLGAEWMQKAALGGNRDAQYYLSTYYRDGRGVVQDHSKAYAWAERSVGGRDPNVRFIDALLLLGSAREWGRGVRQDLVEAYKWFALAAGHSADDSRSFDFASRAMDALSTRLTIEQIIEAQKRADAWSAR